MRSCMVTSTALYWERGEVVTGSLVGEEAASLPLRPDM